MGESARIEDVSGIELRLDGSHYLDRAGVDARSPDIGVLLNAQGASLHYEGAGNAGDLGAEGFDGGGEALVAVAGEGDIDDAIERASPDGEIEVGGGGQGFGMGEDDFDLGGEDGDPAAHGRPSERGLAEPGQAFPGAKLVVAGKGESRAVALLKDGPGIADLPLDGLGPAAKAHEDRAGGGGGIVKDGVRRGGIENLD